MARFEHLFAAFSLSWVNLRVAFSEPDGSADWPSDMMIGAKLVHFEFVSKHSEERAQNEVSVFSGTSGSSGDGAHWTLAVAPDMSRAGIAKAESTEGEVRDLTLRLERDLRQIRSRDVDTEGKPIPDAVISAQTSNGELDDGTTVRLSMAAAADDGWFEIDPIDTELGYLVSCFLPGYVSGMG